jgi:hypothetical protein
MRRTLSVLAVTLVLVGASSCVTHQRSATTAPSDLDYKLSTFAFMEEGDLVTFIVDTRASGIHEPDPYFPLEISVANRGLKNLALTRESFILIDEDGNRYHVASPRDLMQSYEHLDVDQRLAELEGIVYNRFANYTRYPAVFSPTRMSSGSGITPVDAELSTPTTRSPREGQEGLTTVQDRVTLPKWGYFIDFIYFPTPPTGLQGKRFELHMEAPELPHTIFLKFIVLS